MCGVRFYLALGFEIVPVQAGEMVGHILVAIEALTFVQLQVGLQLKCIK
jgi:hypothetical protein